MSAYRPHKVLREDRADGTILLRSGYDMPTPASTTSDWLRKWAAEAPERVFLAERFGEGWRTVSYAEAWEMVQRLAAGLLARGLGPETGPLLILSGNSVNHGLISLAAHHVGIVTVPVAEQYSLIPAAQKRLHFVADLVQPAMVYAEDGAAYGAAIDALGLPAISPRPDVSGAEPFEALLREAGDVAEAHELVTPDSVAKILMTSGSTSDPKGVETTQRMMTTNQAQMNCSLPFLEEKPPVLVDWLPWNHVFGGSHNFNLALSNGGSLYIDDGKPLPALFPRTVENLGLMPGTISFNVPVGFAQLVAALERDPALCQTYFSQLDMIFYAGASLPQDVWAALERLSMDALGRTPLITSSWGLTETAPAAVIQHVPAKGAGIIGVPQPGVTLKLIDDGEGRMDVRVKGDIIFPRYVNNPQKTAEAFDDEGFFISGDAVQFVDPNDMTQGLKFDGRLSEDFKLLTGTWVRAANLRLEVLPALAPLAQDIVITGEGRDEVGLMILPNRAAIEAAGFTLTEADGLCLSELLFAELARRLTPLANPDRGSATRVTRALILSDPPDMGEGEITAKGNLNFPKLLTRRAALVQRLYADTDSDILRLH